MTNTIEEKISAVIGKSKETLLIEMNYKNNISRAMVKKVRGKVMIFMQPRTSDMYISWMVLNGNEWNSDKKSPTVVWAYKDLEFMKQFDGDVAAKIEIC